MVFQYAWELFVIGDGVTVVAPEVLQVDDGVCAFAGDVANDLWVYVSSRFGSTQLCVMTGIVQAIVVCLIDATCQSARNHSLPIEIVSVEILRG